MSPPTIKEMTDDEIQWHQERLNQFEKMLKSKGLKESRAKKDLEGIQANFLEVFKKLYKTSKYFKNAIDNLSPTTHPSDPDLVEELQQDGISMKIINLHNILIEWDEQRLFYKRGAPNLLRTFAILVNLCKKLNSEYETNITMIKLENDINLERLPIYFTLTRSNPIVSLYNVRGKTIKQIEVNAGKRPTRTTKTFNHPPDQIIIRDSNSRLSKCGNVLIDGIAGMSRFTPTVVGYINREGNKKLLVSFPEYFNPTALKEYGEVLAKLHHNFYGKTYKGRPKEMSHQLTLMEPIWKEKCEGKKLSANQKSKILSEEMENKHGVILEPITITRWYLPLLRGKTDKK